MASNVVQGNSGSGNTDTGAPVKVGAKYNATPPTFTDGQRADLQVDSRGDLKALVVMNATGGDTMSAGQFVDQAGNTRGVQVAQTLFNGASWDRARSNVDTTTGDSGAKTTGTFNGATQTNFNARGAIITCLLGTVTGAVTTWQTGLQTSYDGGATWIGLTPLGANDTGATSGRTYTWYVYPTNWSQAAGGTPANLAPAAGATQTNYINAVLPRTWRFTATVSVATSIVITAVYVNYIL